MHDDTRQSDLWAKRRASRGRIERIAYWLDEAFRIPIIGKRIGLDGLIGLIPVLGDFIGLALSSLLFSEAWRLGAPISVWLRMGGNIALDFIVGLIPVIGDIADIAWKANRRNAAIMQRWLTKAAPPGA